MYRTSLTWLLWIFLTNKQIWRVIRRHWLTFHRTTFPIIVCCYKKSRLQNKLLFFFEIILPEAVVWRCSVKKVFLKIHKINRKHLCQSLFFSKAADLRPEVCNLIKKETLAQVFSCEICEILKNTFFYRRLLVAASI